MLQFGWLGCIFKKNLKTAEILFMPSLRSQLRSLFFQRHTLAASQIQIDLAKSASYSLVAIYAELKRMQDEKMLIKEKDRYILSLAWVLDARLSLDNVYRSLLQASQFDSRVLTSDSTVAGRQNWKFSSIYQMNNFWVQLILVLLAKSESKIVYEYIPHLWFAYIEPERDMQYQRTFRTVQSKIEIMVGGDSYLDRFPLRRKNPPAYRCYFSDIPFQDLRSTCYCMIDSWLITIRYPQKAGKDFDRCFSQSDRLREDAIPLLWSLLNRQQNVTVKLEHNTRKAKQLKHIFEGHFLQSKSRNRSD